MTPKQFFINGRLFLIDVPNGFSFQAMNLAQDQKLNYGDEIASGIRMAKKEVKTNYALQEFSWTQFGAFLFDLVSSTPL